MEKNWPCELMRREKRKQEKKRKKGRGKGQIKITEKKKVNNNIKYRKGNSLQIFGAVVINNRFIFRSLWMKDYVLCLLITPGKQIRVVERDQNRC